LKLKSGRNFGTVTGKQTETKTVGFHCPSLMTPLAFFTKGIRIKKGFYSTKEETFWRVIRLALQGRGVSQVTHMVVKGDGGETKVDRWVKEQRKVLGLKLEKDWKQKHGG